MTQCARADLCRFICVLLCVIGVAKAIHIEKFKVPPSVLEGESPKLTCFHSLDPEEPEKALVVKWWWLPIDDAEDRRVIYQRIAGHGPQVLKEGIGVEEDDTIQLLSVDPRDSGTYECEVSVIEEDRKSRRLIVYSEGTGPEINATILQDGDGKNEAVLIECGASDVAPQPELVISVNDWQYTNDSQSLSPATDGRYTVAASVTVPIENFNGEIRCEMNFTHYREVRHLQYVATVLTDDILRAAEATTIRPAATDRHLLRLDIPEDTTSPAQDLKLGDLSEWGAVKLTTIQPRTMAPPPATKRRISRLNIPEVISAAEALKPGEFSNSAISLRNAAGLTALVTLLMVLFPK